MARSYDLHGLWLNVVSETASLLELADAVLGPFAVADPPPMHEEPHCLEIRHGSAPRRDEGPVGMQHFWSGEFPDGIAVAYYAADGCQQIDLLSLASIRFDFTRRRARITVAPEAEWCLPRACLVPALCELLARVDQHVIHAGCLRFDNDGRPRAVLLAGPSGAGKTTASLALAKSGLKLMADDACFAKREGDALEVWGLLLACKVHPRTLDMLPWLGEFDRSLSFSSDEYIIDARRAVGAPPQESIPPGAILFLDDRNNCQHRIGPLDKFDAISMLAGQNLRAPEPGTHARTVAGFGVITDLVSCCGSYLLSIGPRIETLREAILSAVTIE